MKRLAHISDLHFGRIDHRVVDGLLADLTAQAPDLIVISGDLVQRAKPRHFKEASAFLEKLPFPYLVVPGNHDIPVYNVFRRFTNPFGHYRRYITTDLSPLHIDDEMAVLGINTARPVIMDFSEGRMNRRQIKRVREVFSDMPDTMFKVLFTHHPFLPPPDLPGTRLVGRHKLALPALESCGVDLLLAGHLHKAYSGDIMSFHTQIARSILVAQASTATSTRLRNEANAYNLITVAHPDVTFEVRSWEGAAFMGGLVSSYRKHGQRWTLQAQDTGFRPVGGAGQENGMRGSGLADRA
ncbi:3',5'-cyclic-nucleotide phosphodiesterase [Azospirillum thiophilum]|uniref:3',5'-cyclic-nucleotide phosphodiesterase n=1 Tax=Azospirillum thiophilum TaxID=528244 RepID=A0AAC8VXT8_9PROT|nr:metallophosphoesterase [Azospirillum thiophilum]ALG71472.1 3',5'-cyclic-nucleotide phosphodiesterase [Azospirillum thiophilum]KJR64882.1 3',5'-cyclic-nucleotide phosphodiesterase [Azospirillum thiophilum]